MQCLFCGHTNTGDSAHCEECRKPLPVYAAPEGYIFDADKGLYCERTTLPPEQGGLVHTIWFDPVSGEYTQTEESPFGEEGFLSQDVISGVATPDSAFTPDSLLFDELRQKPGHQAKSASAPSARDSFEADKPAGKAGFKQVVKGTVMPIALGVSIPVMLLVLLLVGHFTKLYRLPFLPSFDSAPDASPTPLSSPLVTNGEASATPDITMETPNETDVNSGVSTETPAITDDPESTVEPSVEPTVEPTAEPTAEPIKTPEPPPSATPADNPDPDDPESIAVEWKDSSWEQVFRAYLSIPADPIWPSDLDKVKTVSLNGTSITIDGWNGVLAAKPASYADLAHCRALSELSLCGVGIGSVSALPLGEGLEKLTLSDNAITDLTALSAMTGLRYLDVRGNQITSIAPLAALNSLQALHLARNNIKTIAEIAQMSALQTLTLEENPIEDYSPAAAFGYKNPDPVPTMNSDRLAGFVSELKPVFSTQYTKLAFTVTDLTAEGTYYIATLEGYDGIRVAYMQEDYLAESEEQYAVYIDMNASLFSEGGTKLSPETLRAAYGEALRESGTGGSYKAVVSVGGMTVSFLASGSDGLVGTARVTIS